MAMLRTTLAALMLAAAPALSAFGQDAAQQQARCELAALGNTRSALAIQLIRSACNWLALNGDSLLNAGSRPYYACLLERLSGVQADEAAAAITAACRSAYPP